MNPFRRYQAGRYVKKLRAPGGLDAPDLANVQSRLASLGPEAIRELFASLSGAENRKPALEVLEKLVTPETLPAFVEALCSPVPGIADAAATVLSQAQGYDPTLLLSLFSDPRVSKARLEAVLSAQMKGLQPRMLLKILPDLSKDARPSVFRLLERGADSTIVGDAVQLAVHAEWWLRLHMAKLLARFPTPEGIRAVMHLLEDENRSVRLEAVNCLARFKAVEAIPALCRCLRDRDIKVHTAAIDALIQIGDPVAVPHLLECLKDEAEHVRRGAVEVLNQVVTTEAIKDLVSALRDQDWWVRVRAADALGTLGGERVVDAVIQLLGDDDDFVRRYAVEILNTVPNTRAVEPLIGALDDPDWWVRERAVDALGKTGDARAVDPLLRMLGRDSKAVPLVVKALAQLRDTRAVEPLCRLTASDSAEIRREAIQALVELSSASLEAQTMALVRSTLESLGVRPGRPTSKHEPRPARAQLGVERDRVEGPAPTTPVPGQAPAAKPEPQEAPAAAEAGRTLDYQALPPGTKLLDRYCVLRRIGGGGFGAVYLVEDSIVKEELVLKILNPFLSLDENMIRRFIQELKFTRRITHRSVIRIYDMINLGGAHAISMEYFPGRDLGQVLREEGPLQPARVLRLAAQVCEGLAAAHDLGIIHRDIKPANILVGEGDVAKIVDFGLASVSQTTRSRLTRSGILVGTPEYISPEQITGTDVDGLADVYSFGVVMYEMLTGQQPFSGNNAVNVLFQHLEAEVEPMSRRVPGIPPQVEELVAMTMAKQAYERPASARQLGEMIQATLAMLPSDAAAA